MFAVLTSNPQVIADENCVLLCLMAHAQRGRLGPHSVAPIVNVASPVPEVSGGLGTWR